MNKVSRRSDQRGSTLIEVLIGITIIVLVLVTVTATGTIVTKNRRFSSEQAAATLYSQEGLEWVRSLRNSMGWQAFYDVAVNKGGGGSVVCISTLPTSSAEFSTLGTGACTSDNVISGTIYQRTAQFIIVSPSQINVRTTTTWSDNSQTHQTNAEAVLQEWQ